MKSILFVISTMTGGGAERTVSTLSKYLSGRMNCSVLLNSRTENDYEFYGKIICLGMKPKVKKGLIYQLVAAQKRYKKLRTLKRAGDYDVIISFMESANFLNILTGRSNCKLILSVRNVISEEYKGLSKIILLVARLLYHKADCVVSLSDAAKRDLINNVKVPKDKCVTIYNGYDISNYYFDQNKGRTKFITIGRLVHQKGQWHLIRAFRKVKDLVPEATLKILGQGEYEKYLYELIRYYGLEKSIELVGYVKNPEEYLKESDCFVFSSIYEGFGNAIIEAMMNGLPVITTDFSAAREIIAPELDEKYIINKAMECSFGILSPSSSSKIYNVDQEYDHSELELANAMVDYARGKIGNYYDTNNLERCLARFSIEKAINDWIEMINKDERRNAKNEFKE